MLKTVPGVYRNGKVELLETPDDLKEDTQVLITILATPAQAVDLAARGIDQSQAADLRARLATFAADWEQPEMDVYDDYDAARAAL